MATERTFQTRRGEHGATLVVVMIVLLVVTVIGIAGARLALLGEMSARHDRDYQIAFEAAEAALVDAAEDIEGRVSDLGDSCMAQRTERDFSKGLPPDLAPGQCKDLPSQRGLCGFAPPPAKPTWATMDFLDEGPNARTVAYGAMTCKTYTTGAGLKPARPPRYVIEAMLNTVEGGSASINVQDNKPPQISYRVTAIGFGPRVDTQAIVQMEYRRSTEQ